MLTHQLFESVRPIWESYLKHPFIQGISDGTLPKEKFQYYMIQDYLYLYEYAKVFALGAVKTKDHDLMRFFSSLADSTLNDEMNIHKAYMVRLGITKEVSENTPMALPNQAYTSYMLKAGYEGGDLDILIAVLACSWSYAYIGSHISENTQAASHPFYGEWVEGYSCKDYIRTNDELIAMIDRLGKNISSQRFLKLRDIFVNCSHFETMFWDMAWQAGTGDSHTVFRKVAQ